MIVRSAGPDRLRLIGAVDANNVADVERVLAAALNGHAQPDVHVDLDELEFIDVSGIRALVAAAENARDRHRLILHGLSPLFRKVMAVVGWTDLPSLFIAEAEPSDLEAPASE